MRVIFVGVHNKPGKLPLCGSTLSGKIIDGIINSLPKGTVCIKSNLWDIDQFPYDSVDTFTLGLGWLDRLQPDDGDVIVLLGAIVHKRFPYTRLQADCGIVKLPHPSSTVYNGSRDLYIERGVNGIINKIK